ncbi:hypothetical protein AMECASPLE_029992 [Ameca splendens]|uniref:Uncharacterized protein n=1 Tax=Ameca splendens TaxID=208324 RepID=A0ABV1AD39_9TELE
MCDCECVSVPAAHVISAVSVSCLAVTQREDVMEISLLFKSTAGTSKPAAAGITEIIRHKCLIYIKMLINLSSHCPVRLRWHCVLHNISAVRCVLMMTAALCFKYYFWSFVDKTFTISLFSVC